MSNELTNAAKLAILKYLTTILLSGFTVLSTLAYFIFIKPLDNLELSVTQSVNEKFTQRLDKTIERNQEKFDQAYIKLLSAQADLRSASSEVSKKIEEADFIIEKMKARHEEIVVIWNTVQSTEQDLKIIVQGARDEAASQAGLNLTSMQAEIEALSAELKDLDKQIGTVLAARTTQDAISIADAKQEVALAVIPEAPRGFLPCDPFSLTERQMDLISVKQRVERTDTFSSSDKRYYRNIFSIAIRQDNDAPLPEAVSACVLNAIESVDYHLAENWFTPSLYKRTDPAADFRFSIKVWGSTNIRAEVHLKGDQATLGKAGRFSTADNYTAFLATRRDLIANQ